MSIKYLVVLLAVLSTGCATVNFNGSETKITKVDNPPIGQVVTSYVGDPLVQKGEIVEEKILQVNQAIDGVGYDIPQGNYPQIGFDENATYFSSSGVIRNALAAPHKALMLGKEDGAELCVVTVFNAKFCYTGDYEKTSKISERGTSFQQTLIYSGRVGDKINIGYREFSNNLARPAFNNDVEYDLAASNIIGYKGSQLEIIKADNTSITYRVLKSFP